jgi:hypothetical protein
MVVRGLIGELTARLELHLNQLCDESACETPEHKETRELIERGRAAVRPLRRPVEIMLTPEEYL